MNFTPTAVQKRLNYCHTYRSRKKGARVNYMILPETVPTVSMRDAVSSKKMHKQQFQKCSEAINSQSVITNALSSKRNSKPLFSVSCKVLILEYEWKMNRQ